MKASSQFGLNVCEFSLQPRALALAQDGEVSIGPFSSANVGKAQKVKRFMLALASIPPVFLGGRAKLDEPRLVRMQFQAELGEALRQGGEKGFCLRLGPDPLRGADKGSPGFRAECFHACMGSLTAQDPAPSRHIDGSDVAFRLSVRRRHPKVDFRELPSLHVPLSTLPHALAGRRGRTRGRRGWLHLQRMKLALTTLCRLDRRFQGDFANAPQ